jgi:hypothetical protein
MQATLYQLGYLLLPHPSKGASVQVQSIALRVKFRLQKKATTRAEELRDFGNQILQH